MPRLDRLTWLDFDEQRRSTDLALLPIGAVEVYGPHLPMGADGIAAQALADGIAAQLPAFVAPLVPVGFSRNLREYPGTLIVPPVALVAYVRGIAESLIGWGCRRLLFLNGHNGNTPFINELAGDLEIAHNVCCAQIDFWRFIQPLVADLVASDYAPHGHGAEFGTSVMLHLVPDYVRPERITPNAPEPPDHFPDVQRLRPYRDRMPSGGLGDPTHATAAKGAEVLNRAITRAIAFVTSPDFQPPP